MKKRYERNMHTISEKENEFLADCNICVVGCGGLGGYIIEILGRLGIGRITAIDGDVFDETNLNRQIISEERLIGWPKAVAAEERMHRINSDVEVNSIIENVNEENVKELCKGYDIVIDALDNIPCRLILERACEEMRIPLIHGAIGGWYGQVAVVMPGDRTLSKIYSEDDEKGEEKELGTPSFIPAVVAGIEAAEAVKVLLKKETVLSKKLLSIDLLRNEYEIDEI